MALETSSGAGSVALAEGGKLLSRRRFSADQQHAGELLVVMDELTRIQGWKPIDINHLYVSAGPGSFTGIRIAVTCAKAMSFAGSVKIVAVPSTDVRVLNAEGKDSQVPYAAVVIDAKRKGVYVCLYKRIFEGKRQEELDTRGLVPGYRCLLEPQVMRAEEVLERVQRPIYLLGDGLRFHGEKLKGEGVFWLGEEYWEPDAANVLRCGWLRAEAGVFTPAGELTPIYLRRPEAVERWEKLHGEE